MGWFSLRHVDPSDDDCGVFSTKMNLDFTCFLAERNNCSVVHLGVDELEIDQDSWEFGLYYYKNYNTTCDIKTWACAGIIFSCYDNWDCEISW